VRVCWVGYAGLGGVRARLIVIGSFVEGVCLVRWMVGLGVISNGEFVALRRFIAKTDSEVLKLLEDFEALEVWKIVCRRPAFASKCGASAHSLNCP
jgi:hypothetical protein